ncbi:MAG: 23S rRNA (guanine(2445)-N(2))/(guanine(2069)-N(7))-methyltransferase, partial [Methylococcus sp.]
MQHRFFVTAGKGLTALLRDELVGFGLTEVVEKPGGVYFDGSLQQAYRTCLWSRIGNRVLLQLDIFPCTTADALYQGIRQTNWAKHMQSNGSFFVRFLGTDPAIRNSHFGALRVKDAIVDQFRESSGERPSVSTEQPDLQVYVHLSRSKVALYLDLSG